jgi:hypothetical protein
VATMVIEVPEELKDLGEAMVDSMAAVKKALGGVIGGRALDYEGIECDLAESVARIERTGHRAILQALDVDRPAVMINGSRHARVGREEATYYTMAGPVVIMRSLYRKCGERNAKTVDAVSLRAGVVADGWLPHTARAMAHDVQQATSREAEASAREHKRLEYSRSSFERVAHAVGALYVPAHVDIEDALIDAYEIPAEATSVSSSLDRVSVPMEEPLGRPVGRPKKGAAKRPVARNFRMAYCGTVTLHDADGDALHTIRYGRMPQGDAEALCAGMAADVLALLSKRPGLKVQLLCDGAPEMWNLLEAQFSEETLGVEIHKLVDFCHVVEKLGKAARVVHPEPEAKAVVQRWRLGLMNRTSAADAILGELRASGMEHIADGDLLPVHDAITYLDNHDTCLDFAGARRLGLPIGSGNVEATCKSLFNVRMKRGGARWKEETGEHVVQLRALALSDRWSDAMDLTLPLSVAVRPAA